MKKVELPTVLQALSENTGKILNYLVGDPAYSLTLYCMKEYDQCSTNTEVIYNNILRRARNPTECAFCRLKYIKLENVPAVIYACFVLHNFCEQHDISGAHLGFSEGRGLNFRKGANQHKTNKKRI